MPRQLVRRAVARPGRSEAVDREQRPDHPQREQAAEPRPLERGRATEQVRPGQRRPGDEIEVERERDRDPDPERHHPGAARRARARERAPATTATPMQRSAVAGRAATMEPAIAPSRSGATAARDEAHALFTAPHRRSAIWTALSAAPLRRLSEATKKTSPLGSERSRRTRPTSTASRPTLASGIG